MVLALLLLACRTDDPDWQPPPEPFTWTDTAVYTDYEPLPRFSDGKAPTNLLFLSIDTLRRDHLGRYGGAPTPFLDRIASEGFTLDDHVQCANWTFASTSCTLAGRTAIEARHMPLLTQIPEPLPDGEYLATWLAEGGFATMLVSGNPWLSPVANNAQGYQVALAPLSPQHVEEVFAMGQGLLEETTTPDTPWFLHLHVTEPHAPYTPPESYLDALDALEPLPFDVSDRDAHYATTGLWPTLPPEEQALLEAHLRARYAADVQWLDDQLELAWAELDAGGWLDDTLVVVWTDHGEQFWERGQQSHAWMLGAEENDAVLVFWSKDIEAGSWDGPTHAVDLAPTLLDLYGLEQREQLTGIPLGAARTDRKRFTEVAARAGGLQAVLSEEHKLVYHWPSGRLTLFDRDADPGETTDLADARPEVVEELWALLAPRAEAMEPLVPGFTRVAP